MPPPPRRRWRCRATAAAAPAAQTQWTQSRPVLSKSLRRWRSDACCRRAQKAFTRSLFRTDAAAPLQASPQLQTPRMPVQGILRLPWQLIQQNADTLLNLWWVALCGAEPVRRRHPRQHPRASEDHQAAAGPFAQPWPRPRPRPEQRVAQRPRSRLAPPLRPPHPPHPSPPHRVDPCHSQARCCAL